MNGTPFLRAVYVMADPEYAGRVGTPVPWDRATETIVNNGSREIVRMFDTQFGAFTEGSPEFYPEDLRAEIDRTIDGIYEPTDTGV